MNAEWDIPFLIESPYGELPINDVIGSGTTRWTLDPANCEMGVDLRITADNIPQADGQIMHRRFRAGYFVRLSMLAEMAPEQPACGEALRVMVDELQLHLNALLNEQTPDVDDDHRLRWQPSGWPSERMLDHARLLVRPTYGLDGPWVKVGFTLDSDLPYAIDLTQSTDTLNAVIDHLGNVPFFPTFRVHGPFTTFNITNITSGLSIIYDGGQPGATGVLAGHYAEINTFRNTVYLDGNSTNLKPGIVIPSSDFFAIGPGLNDLQYFDDASGSCDMLWNNAWS